MTLADPINSQLGKTTQYESHYNADLLFPIPRAPKRKAIGINPISLPFFGFDCWNHYEVSWLNAKGKPVVATAVIVYPCDSVNLMESKSVKLYFNSFNNSKFNSVEAVEETVKKDFSARLHVPVYVKISPIGAEDLAPLRQHFGGESLDNQDIEITTYTVDPTLLTASDEVVEETLHSDLLKSNCLVTGQPDWGSVQIHYRGPKIDRAGLLRYLVSFRNHNEFHEQCIERIFQDITQQCKPTMLRVYGRYTRRGGVDINPYRSTEKTDFIGDECRLIRQ